MSDVRDSLEGTRSTINTRKRNIITPPIHRNRVIRNRKENNQRAQRNGDLERSRKNQGILLPPLLISLLDVYIKDVGRVQARDEVAVVVRSQVESTAEEDGDVDAANPARGEALGEEVEGDWEEEAPEETVEGDVVDAVAEHALGADDTPDDGCSEENGGSYSRVLH